ncbi:MAG TPA: hypothetical protein VMS55_02045 [Myxococcota bacterium]|nr:hypothetical protein [Myxococcota bacterium]
MSRSLVSLTALLAAGGIGSAGSADPPQIHPQVHSGEVLVREIVSVTGTVRMASLPAGQGSAVELDSVEGGRFRIEPLGLGAELLSHVDEHVTVTGFVEPFEQDGRPVLRVSRIALLDRKT